MTRAGGAAIWSCCNSPGGGQLPARPSPGVPSQWIPRKRKVQRSAAGQEGQVHPGCGSDSPARRWCEDTGAVPWDLWAGTASNTLARHALTPACPVSPLAHSKGFLLPNEAKYFLYESVLPGTHSCSWTASQTEYICCVLTAGDKIRLQDSSERTTCGKHPFCFLVLLIIPQCSVLQSRTAPSLAAMGWEISSPGNASRLNPK